MTDQAQAVTASESREGEGVGSRLATVIPSRGSDYAELSRRVRQAGLLDRRPVYYVLKIGLNTILLAVAPPGRALERYQWPLISVAADKRQTAHSPDVKRRDVTCRHMTVCHRHGVCGWGCLPKCIL